MAVINSNKLNVKSRKNSTLTMLSASALAIPGAVEAATAPEKETVSVRYTQYQEAPLETGRVSSGNTGRFGIDVLQVGYSTP